VVATCASAIPCQGASHPSRAHGTAIAPNDGHNSDPTGPTTGPPRPALQSFELRLRTDGAALSQRIRPPRLTRQRGRNLR